VPGRAVSEEAYALYARAAFLEASGDVARALAVYERVLDYDPWSVESWARIGALRCRADPAIAERAFEAGLAIDDEFEPLWRERSRCYLSVEDHERGLHAALRAASLDPNRVETSLLVVEAFQVSGDSTGARRWLDGLIQRSPTSPVAWRGALTFAERNGDRELARRAAWHLARLRPNLVEAEDPEVVRAAIDQALLGHDLDQARSLAVRGRVPPVELALRAALLARPKLAREQALLVLRADPRNGDAWVAALVAADLDHDLGLLEEVAAYLDADPVSPSPTGVRLLGELLERIVGPAAAQAWAEAYGPLPEPAAGLERRAIEPR
jgi:tetratricopeptide (TPR) repeat protein